MAIILREDSGLRLRLERKTLSIALGGQGPRVIKDLAAFWRISWGWPDQEAKKGFSGVGTIVQWIRTCMQLSQVWSLIMYLSPSISQSDSEHSWMCLPTRRNTQTNKAFVYARLACARQDGWDGDGPSGNSKQMPPVSLRVLWDSAWWQFLITHHGFYWPNLKLFLPECRLTLCKEWEPKVT